MNRVMVFVDDGSFRRGGFAAFGPTPTQERPPFLDPMAISQVLLEHTAARRALEAVRVYRAVPDGRVDEPAFAAAIRQMERWTAAGVIVVRRPMNETSTRAGDPDHKGLAIALATDLLSLALRDQYDVAIVCSFDNDLEPALRAVLDQTWKSVEVAAWRNPSRPAHRLSVPTERLRCHWLDGRSYAQCIEAAEG